MEGDELMEVSAVYYVRGCTNGNGGTPLLFLSKADAEKYARMVYPNETPDARYARIFYTDVCAFRTRKFV